MSAHEAVHSNIAGLPMSGETPLLGRAVQAIIAFTSAKALGCIGSPADHQTHHMNHHRFTNIHGKDPQIIPGKFLDLVKGLTVVPLLNTARLLVSSAILETVPRYLLPYLGWQPTEWSLMGRCVLVLGAVWSTWHPLHKDNMVMLAGCIMRRPWDVQFLLLVPQGLAAGLVGFVFQVLPHYPQMEVGRYRDTRITTIGNWEPLRTLLSFLVFCGQDYHLLHHLYPRVPWTRLKRMYHQLEPVLEKRKVCIVDGRGIY